MLVGRCGQIIQLRPVQLVAGADLERFKSVQHVQFVAVLDGRAVPPRGRPRHCTAFWWYCRPRACTISCTYTESQSVVPYAAASRSHVKVPPKMYGRIMVHSTTVPVHVGPARPAVVPHEFPHVSARTVKKTTSTSSAAGAPSAVVLG